MSRDERASKLEALRARLDTAKAQNHADMEEEKKREMDPEYKKRAERGLAEVKADAAVAGSKRQMRSSGLSDKVSIAQSQVWDEYAEKKKDRKAVTGGGVLSPEVQLKAFERRAAQNVKVDLAHYQKMKASDPNFFPTADSLAVGKPYKPTKDKVDQMTAELVGQMEKRAAFSRRRSTSRKRMLRISTIAMRTSTRSCNDSLESTLKTFAITWREALLCRLLESVGFKNATAYEIFWGLYFISGRNFSHRNEL